VTQVSATARSSRPLPARRADLIVREQQFQGRLAFFVKDPLSLRYYKFAVAEYRLFELLDGRRNVEELHETFIQEPSQSGVTIEDISQLVQRWQQVGLLEDVDSAGTSRQFVARQQLKQQSQWFGWLSQILYLKLHAFDPDALLNRLYPWVRWLFHPVGVAMSVVTMLAAVMLVIGSFDQFSSRPELQNFQAYFNLQNIFWLWLTIGVVKVLHEFGHALTCKHFGGECHAMGMLFMCFSPCLYCDVSDSWMLPNKWHRIAIAAAGVYVELLTASLATFVWWWTPPGVLHSIAFSAMLFGSVQTLLINANPLMKFDGYYMLSDFLEVPNLRQKSYLSLRHHLVKWCWGSDRTMPGPTGLRGLLFTSYAVAATVYGWMVTILMLWFLTQFLAPHKLAIIGWGLAVLAAINTFVLPLWMGITSVARKPSMLKPRHWWRPLLALTVLAAAVYAISVVPVPRRVYAVMTIEPKQSRQITVLMTGQVRKIHVQPGAAVEVDQLLVELDNPELRLAHDRLTQERDTIQVRLNAAQASLDPAAIQQLEVLLKEIDSQRLLQQKRLDDLLIRSPCAGVIVPEPDLPAFDVHDAARTPKLSRWLRSPLDQQNVGAVLEAGTPVCRIVESADCEAVAILPQNQVEFVKASQPVALKLDAFPGETLVGTVRELGVQEVFDPPAQLLNVSGSELPAVTFGPEAGQLASPHYRVRIELTGFSRPNVTSQHVPLRPGLRGRMWIRSGSQTLALIWWRSICEVIQN
jgi:putative peptide zinc metalloprotease protein